MRERERGQERGERGEEEEEERERIDTYTKIDNTSCNNNDIH